MVDEALLLPTPYLLERQCCGALPSSHSRRVAVVHSSAVTCLRVYAKLAGKQAATYAALPAIDEQRH